MPSPWPRCARPRCCSSAAGAASATTPPSMSKPPTPRSRCRSCSVSSTCWEHRLSTLDALLFGEIDPPQRLLMGPGPVNAHPRVLRAMAADLLGQFDPEFTAYMNETMALYRRVFMTENRWSLLIDGTARAGIEAALVSLIEPDATVLIVRSGRFGLLLTEIVERIGGKIETVDAEWGEVVPFSRIEEAARRVKPQ